MFKNVRFLRLTSAWPESAAQLNEALAAAVFKPCGPLTEKASGWERPVDGPDAAISRRVGGADLLQLRTQSRVLPTAAVNEAVEVRLEEYRDRTGGTPSPREKRRLKLEIRDNLMTKALLQSERTKGFFLLSEGILGVDAASPAKVERFLDMLRAPLGQLDASPLTFARPVGDLLTRIFLGDAPPGVRMGCECRMQDRADGKASVRWVDMDLTDANIRKHVRDGMSVTHLELEGVMSCVMDENGGLGKLRLLGMDAEEVSDEEDPLARFDAEFVMLTGMLRRLIGVLSRSLGGLDQPDREQYGGTTH